MRVLVCGDRNWRNIEAILRELKAFPWDTVIIEGEARGADTLGRWAAKSLGLAVESYPADWARYGRAAGVIRNQQMLDEGKPDAVLAFHSHILDSKGTKDMVRRASNAGIPVRIITK